MTVSAFQVVKDFEQAVAEYTGAPYVVSVTSCTMALLLALKWCNRRVLQPGRLPIVTVPSRTYVSVPMSVLNAGYQVNFEDQDWSGKYQLNPLPVWDSARYFSKGMYKTLPGQYVCLSFHATKTLGDTQGGAILTDNKEAAAWLRKMRFDGRTEGAAPKDDAIDVVGYHCYLSPDVAARLLLHMHALPEYNLPLPNDDYPYLPNLPVFARGD